MDVQGIMYSPLYVPLQSLAVMPVLPQLESWPCANSSITCAYTFHCDYSKAANAMHHCQAADLMHLQVLEQSVHEFECLSCAVAAVV